MKRFGVLDEMSMIIGESVDDLVEVVLQTFIITNAGFCENHDQSPYTC
jgi:hypothetical protein